MRSSRTIALEPYRYHLQSARRYRPHLLTEPEEKIDAEKDVTGRSAWVRLFSELSAEIKITMPDGTEAAARARAVDDDAPRPRHPTSSC